MAPKVKASADLFTSTDNMRGCYFKDGLGNKLGLITICPLARRKCCRLEKVGIGVRTQVVKSYQPLLVKRQQRGIIHLGITPKPELQKHRANENQACSRQ